MNSPAPPLVFAEPLADRQGALAGLLWHAVGDAVALAPWLDSEGYQHLASLGPCVWRAERVADWPAATAAVLAATPSFTEPSSALWRCDSGWPSAAPPSARWIHGHWHQQAPAKPTTAQAASRSAALRLLELVTNDAATHAIEEVFRQQATLSYQLLRIVNAVGQGTQREITSFAQAILMMGRQPLRRWLNLLLFAARNDDPRSTMLMAQVVRRARGMEGLAQAAGQDRAAQDQAFMTGMFSLLGTLFGQPLAQVLAPLKLTTEAVEALLHHRGPAGQLLQLWTAVEAANETVVRAGLHTLQITPATFNRLQVEVSDWMWRVTRERPTA